MATKFFDKKTGKTYSIAMLEFDGTNYSPDMTADIIGPEYGYNAETGAYMIDDITALLDWLDDWERGKDDDTRAALQDLIDEYGDPADPDEYSDDPANGYLGRHPVLSAREDIENRVYTCDCITD